jgi:hypothetical protein
LDVGTDELVSAAALGVVYRGVRAAEHLLEHIVVMTVLSRLAIRPRLCKNFLAARKRFLMAFLAQIPSGNAPALSRS